MAKPQVVEQASSAASVRSRVRSKAFQVEWTSKFGVRVAAREAVSGEAVSVTCLFCEHFGREGEGDDESRKRKRTANVQVFKQPWRGDNIRSHMLKQHALRYAAYRALSPADKNSYFGVDAAATDADAVAVVSVAPPTVSGSRANSERVSPATEGDDASNRNTRVRTDAAAAAAAAVAVEPPTVAAVDAAVGMSRLVESPSSAAREAADAAVIARLRPAAPTNSVDQSSDSLRLLVDSNVVDFVCSSNTADAADSLAAIGFALQPAHKDAANSDARRYLLRVESPQQLQSLVQLLCAGFSLSQCDDLLPPVVRPAGSTKSIEPVRAQQIAQQLCAMNLQALVDALASCWAFALVLDIGVGPQRRDAGVDVRVRFTIGSALYDVHVLALSRDESASADRMLKRVTQALDAVSRVWRHKLVGIAIDGAALVPPSVTQVVETLQREHVASPGCYTIWSGARDVDAAVQRALALVCDSTFLDTLALVTDSARLGQADGASCCSAVTSTQWRSLQRVLAWCVTHSSDLQRLDLATPAWWVALYALHAVVDLASACVTSLESLAAHGAAQSRAIEKLLLAVVAHGYVDGPSRFRADATTCAVRGDYRVTFESAEMFVKQHGPLAAEALAAAASPTAVHRVAAMLAAAASELATLRTERARMTGLSDILPAVRPQDLVATTSAYDLSRVVSLQRDRLRESLDAAAIDAVTTDFAAYLVAAESDDAKLKRQLDALPANASFAASWRCGAVDTKFPALCRFAGGLASVYRDPTALPVARARNAADAATRNAALHAEQFDAMRRLAQRIAE